MDVGTRIKNLREEVGLTQLAFAKILNINNSTLCQYENGDRMPSDDIKGRIADHFCVSMDYLMGRTNVREKPAPADGDGLTEEQMEIVKLYAAAPDALRAAALAVLRSAEGQGRVPGEVSKAE